MKKNLKNIHMTHLVDLVFNEGVIGTRKTIMIMKDLRDMLSNETDSSITVTTKFDGSVSFFLGFNPENQKLFVAKKSIFNVVPKVYYNDEDIDNDTSGDLALKLKVALQEGSKLGITEGVYQGDVLFTKCDIKKQFIDNEEHYIFHPNTIVYAVPVSSDIGTMIGDAEFGIVWHTSYTGDCLSELSASFGEPIVEKFLKNKSIFMIDAVFDKTSDSIMFTCDARRHFDELLSTIGRKFQNIKSVVLNSICNDKELLKLIHIFNNLQVRQNKKITNAKNHTECFYDFIISRFLNEEEKKKTDDAKLKIRAKRDNILSFFTIHDYNDIVNVFDLVIHMDAAKMFLMGKLNHSSLKTFLKTDRGLHVTRPEGFVVIKNNEPLKLVDRYSFSQANFSTEFLKGFNR